jgi:hypothetical protein
VHLLSRRLGSDLMSLAQDQQGFFTTKQATEPTDAILFDLN